MNLLLTRALSQESNLKSTSLPRVLGQKLKSKFENPRKALKRHRFMDFHKMNHFFESKRQSIQLIDWTWYRLKYLEVTIQRIASPLQHYIYLDARLRCVC